MKRIFAIASVLFFSATVFAQEGKQFPNLEGETLEQSSVMLPASTMGKLTLIGMAYSKKAESTLNTWYTPMYDKFVLKRGMFDSMYDVNLYFVPMYTGAKKLAYDATLKSLRESNRKDLFPYILFYKGELDQYKDELKMDDKNLPYFFMLDEEGKIVYATKGLYSEKKMGEIEKVLDSRL